VFKAQLTRLKLNDVELYHCCEYLSRIAYISLPPKCIFLSFPIGVGSLVCDGLTLRNGDTVVHSRDDHTHQRTGGARQWGLISIASDEFSRCGRALTGREMALPEASTVFRPARAEAMKLHRIFKQAFRFVETNHGFIKRPEAAREFEQKLLHAIVNCVSGNAESQRRERHAAIMARFEEALSRHVGLKLAVPALCAEIGVPERTLRMCCTEFLAVSPMRYLQLKRLNDARAALQRADPATTTVAEVAREHHFLELGRFAVTYRTIFGESPSATLQKNSSGLQQRAENA
jgi:AraC-like DNA-binding protein